MRLANKVAIITGAQRGIGLAIAQRFINEGATVVLADVNDASAEALALSDSADRARSIRTDVSNDAQVKALMRQTLEHYGRIDILVNNAGIEFAKTVVTTTEDEWDQLMAVNLKGVFLCSRAVIPQMQQQGAGVIINIASELGLVGEAGVAAYCASKGGVVMLSKALAIDHGPQGIRVNCLCPGPVTTQLLEDVFASSADPGAMRAVFESQTVLKRLGRPEEVAAAAAFLASDDSSFMAGADLVVDGGWTTR
ncbi:SDR family NAD(P)-dependent oxidoreductase [Pseudomonas fontis]|uniref:Glucose 1-dehydrogenase n=1 Tax=Pseudomonas fontis TaxID=2942633 RepID=A0ABT5NYZ6_9PSED|nr:glucose 1-dehydrogenase [Pseudomonas fontis]MDD0977316.1 glucose 1-dehydrogenase [Pseudomonas fontis]MDD0993385.1 glucose 1-dehydrogenase [Pseudomonas fontis]